MRDMWRVVRGAWSVTGGQALEVAVGDASRIFPGPIDADEIAGLTAFGARFNLVGDNPFHSFGKGGAIGFEQPTGAHKFKTADTRTEMLAHCGNAISMSIIGEIIGGAAASDHHWQSAGHGLEDGQPENLATVGGNETIAGGV